MDFFSLISLIGGLTFFLYGMSVMSSSLEKMSGGKLEEMLRQLTAKPLLSMVLGAVITIAVQSSSSTTVMLVGLVNSGIMQFSQTVNVIFGANIGTTFTAWLTSLSGIDSDAFFLQLLKPKNFSPILAFIGILMIMFSKRDKRKSVGTAFVGFAILMYGMELMAAAMSPLADMPELEGLLVQLNNPILGVLVGLLFTAVIQSSAASIAILQALSMTGAITYGMAIPIVMGLNIGTCATSLISCIGTNIRAKRVAVLHVSIKAVSTVICLSLFELLNAIFHFPFVGLSVHPWQIALVHTIFNIVTTILLMPFSQQLVRLTEKVVRERNADSSPLHADAPLLDDRLLRAPSIATAEAFNVSTHMALQAQDILLLGLPLAKNYNLRDDKRILEMEDQLDQYEDKLGTYLVKLSAQALSSSDSQVCSKILHAIGDFERLGDHAVNLVRVAREIDEKQIAFSPAAQAELDTITAALDEILDVTVQAYLNNDADMAGRVEPLEQVIDRLTSICKDNHIRRLQKGSCTIAGGFILSDLLNNYQRISDHCSNIAVAIIEVEHNSFDTHRYLNGVKYGNSVFNEIYDQYAQKYSL